MDLVVVVFESDLKSLRLVNLTEIDNLQDVPLREVWHMARFWVSYGRCTMPGSPMGRSEGSSIRWTG